MRGRGPLMRRNHDDPAALAVFRAAARGIRVSGNAIKDYRLTERWR
jgi:hypothetical protein